MRYLAPLLLAVLVSCEREDVQPLAGAPGRSCSTEWAFLETEATLAGLGVIMDTVHATAAPFFCEDPDVLRVDLAYTGGQFEHSFLLVADSSAATWIGQEARVPAFLVDVTADTVSTPATRSQTMHNLRALRLPGASAVVLLVDGYEVWYTW